MEHKSETYHEKLKRLMDEHVHFVYDLTKKFPKEEIYGVTSQLRRATLSIALNYVEGYARTGDKTHRQFLNISYGSLKESDYLLDFSLREQYISQTEYNRVKISSAEIGAMLWGVMRKL